MAWKLEVFDGPIPDHWEGIAHGKKTFLGWPQWPSIPPPPARKNPTSYGTVQTSAAEKLELVTPLADENEVGLEGVRLRLTVWAYKPLREVTATLEVEGGRNFITIARVDAWPVDPHINPVTRRKIGLSALPSKIDGHHVHRFGDNAKLGISAFAPYGNLPIAASIPDALHSFRDFLRTVSKEFRIKGLEQLDPPDWQVLI